VTIDISIHGIVTIDTREADLQEEIRNGIGADQRKVVRSIIRVIQARSVDDV
jgi:hypothetical protein